MEGREGIGGLFSPSFCPPQSPLFTLHLSSTELLPPLHNLVFCGQFLFLFRSDLAVSFSALFCSAALYYMYIINFQKQALGLHVDGQKAFPSTRTCNFSKTADCAELFYIFK